LQLGDHLWSVGKITADQQEKKGLEASLSSLPVTVFTASPADWDKAMIAARQSGSSNSIRTKLQKVSLQF
jgi:hypothetical protein